ncbi:MAG TPA: hypothetical protein VHX60_16255 [Acidobacteriaceae bacterium]|jgi:hypothetical protein|nr:hypothetical protein [Acidobacteriaceae bacterium]
MGLIAIKPRILAPNYVKKNAARKKGPMRMTIAIGALCSEGLIVAADTRVVMSDGATSVGVKVHTGMSATCSFVIANATEDGNAANTLIPDIIGELEQRDPQSLTEAETNVRTTMTHWVSQHPHGAPAVQLIIGINVDRPVFPGGREGGGIELYFCEPPNTMVRKTALDDCRGYIAIGAGSVVTDPIFRSFFAAPAPTRQRLLQISYLMYRAKKDMASACGGTTNAVVLRRTHEFPIWISHFEMDHAENQGSIFDYVLRRAASEIVGILPSEGDHHYLATVGELCRKTSEVWRGVDFTPWKGTH